MIFGGYSSLARKGTFAILDQGLFSGTNFIVYILLARWLDRSQYGAFAVAFSVFLFFGALYTAIIIEPMLVFGPGKYKAHQGRYTALLTYIHVYATLPLAFLLVLVAFLLGHFYTTEVKNAMIGLSISSPMILFLWLTRRAFYVRFKPAWSAMGGFLYLLLFIGTVVAIHKLGRLTQATVFVAMGCSSLAVALILLYFLAPQWRRIANPTLPEIAREHWRYGRWALGTACLTWIPSNIYYVILPAIVGLSGVAVLRALMNLALPAQHTIAALSILILPVFSKTVYERGISGMASKAKMFLIFFLVMSCIYFAALCAFNRGILVALYANQYIEFAHMVPLIGLLPILASIIVVLSNMLRAMQRPDKILWCYAASSAVALTFGITLASIIGVRGAVIGLILTSITTVCVLFLFFKRFHIK